MRPETRQPSRMTDLQRHLAVKRVTCVAANMFSDWLKFLWRWKIRHCPERQKLHFLKTTHTIWLCSVLQQTKSDWRGFSVGGMNRVLQETDSVIIILIIKKNLPFWRLGVVECSDSPGCLVSSGGSVFQIKKTVFHTRKKKNPDNRGASLQPDYYRGPIWLITLSINPEGNTARTRVAVESWVWPSWMIPSCSSYLSVWLHWFKGSIKREKGGVVGKHRKSSQVSKVSQ